MKKTKKIQHQGFALIATITILSLIVMVTLALVSLSTTTTRTASYAFHLSEAKANARLALATAISNLQHHLGPDQRVTAMSSILDSNPSTVAIDGVAHPHYLGVWNSWNTYLNEQMTIVDDSSGSTSTIRIQDTYKAGRGQDLFRRWMFSVPNDATAEDLSAVTQAAFWDSKESIELLRAGTIGSTPSIQAGLVPIETGGNTTGKFAWWIGSNNLRASINNYTAEPSDSNPEDIQVKGAEVGHVDLSAISGLGAYPTDEERLKVITRQTAGLLVDRDDLKNYYFDFTAGGYSIFTNVRSGGLKKDINLLFELASTPTQYGQMTYPHSKYSDLTFDASLRNFETERGELTEPLNPFHLPSSWRYLREYYRLYKSASGYDSHNGKAIDYTSSGVPFTDPYITSRVAGGKFFSIVPDVAFYPRMPVLMRFAYIIGLRTKEIAGSSERDLFVTSSPVIVYWNPYNIEMRIPANQFILNASFPKALRFDRTLKDFDAAGNILSNGAWEHLHQHGSVGGVASLSDLEIWGVKGSGGTHVGAAPTIYLKPGEMKLYTTQGSGLVWHAFEGFQLPSETTIHENGAQQHVGTSDQNPATAIRFSRGDNFTSPGNPENLYYWGLDRSSMGLILRDREFGSGVHDEYGDVFDVITAWNTTSFGMLAIDWMETADDYSEIVSNEDADIPEYDMATDGIRAIGVVSWELKTPEFLAYSDDVTLPQAADDFNNRTFLHTNYFSTFNVLQSPNDLTRSISAYRMHYVNADGNAIGDFIQHDGANTFFGPSYTASGVKRFIAQELPTAPITNLAAFATMPLVSSRTQNNPSVTLLASAIPAAYKNNLVYRVNGHQGASYGVGIGNSYQHPMMPLESVQHKADGSDGGVDLVDEPTGLHMYADFWDNQVIANDVLWDEYFCSSLAPRVSNGVVTSGGSLLDVANNFFGGTNQLHNDRIIRLSSKQVVPDLVESANNPASEGYIKVAAHLAISGGFNINSTSVNAWKSLLHGLKGRKLPYVDETGVVSVIDEPNFALLSRFRRVASDQEGVDPDDVHSWQGIRKLTDEQLDRLAEEMVRQVKLRGPFLNMSEFINRRLDSRTAVIPNTTTSYRSLSKTSALQAAIDWDEFNQNFDGTVDSSSYTLADGSSVTHLNSAINGRYKGAGMMRTSSPTSDYKNPDASLGSNYAGIPGYTMASDILQALGSVPVPRCDSYVIRAYGSSQDADGNTIAEVWCEATVRRSTNYVDSSDDDWEARSDKFGSDSGLLSDTNKKLGRKMRVMSFKWLSKDEV